MAGLIFAASGGVTVASGVFGAWWAQRNRLVPAWSPWNHAARYGR